MRENPMTDNTTEISFIPKSSLVRGDSFMERIRPRSIVGVLSILVFILTVGTYTGLYFYGNSLEEKNKKIAADIVSAQSVFNQSPEISKAKVFRDHAEIARELLDAHIAVSPVLRFIEQNTVQSILYEKFSFTRDGNNLTLELTGEAPTYASLAYQADVLREKSKELTGFSIGDVVLTKFGTITFTIKAVFARGYLSYLNTRERETANAVSSPAELASKASVATMSTATTSVMNTAPLSPQFVDPLTTTTATTTLTDDTPLSELEVSPRTSASVETPDQASEASSFWSWFKFW